MKLLLNLATPDATLSVAEYETGMVAVAVEGCLMAVQAGFAYRLTTDRHELTGEAAEDVAELAAMWDVPGIIARVAQSIGPFAMTAPEEER